MLRKVNFQELFTISPNPYMVLDRELKFVAANDAYLEATGRRREDLIGVHIFDAFPGNPDDPNDSGVRQLRASLERVLTEGVPDVLALIPYRIPRQTEDGVLYEENFWSATHTPILDEQGEVVMILQHTVNITELQKLKQEIQTPDAVEFVEQTVLNRAQVVQEANRLLDSERRHLRRLFEQAPGFIAFLRGPQHIFELANRAYYQVVGHRELIGKPVLEALPEVRDQGFVEILDEVYATAEPYSGRGDRILLQRKQGAPLEEVFVDFVYQPIIEPDGSVSGIFVQGSDVSEQKRTQDQLRRYQNQLEELVRERTQALEQSQTALRQAQKMEAVGNLTGGVAHDFNNLLQIIAGNLQLLQRYIAGNERAERQLQTAISAVDRGARLSSQLLAFARRQPLEPNVVHLGQLIRRTDDLLRRALGEAIAIHTTIADDLWNVFADPHQLENVILNLAINARDAMNGSGTLSIDIRNAVVAEPSAPLSPHVPQGEYVRLTLSDNGAGMPAHVLERAFEPFFTTKSEGHGTGLGLSMAYGFVKQSDGYIELNSEVGVGTTIQIYLPRTIRTMLPDAAALTAAVAEKAVPIEGGSETILVVEDNREVRDTVVEMLTDIGYSVLTAPDGQSALDIIQSGLSFDLLFTDVVMPGPVRSTELARQAAELVPGIAVLFTSGYAEDAIVHGGRLDPGITLLGKPYRLEELARKIRHVLRSQQKSAARPPVAPRDPPTPNGEAASLRVLLVEDDSAIRYVATEFMTELGHTVIAAASAEEAIEALNRAPVDLLFTDVSLPGMSGVALAQTVRERHPDMPVIFASGYGLSEEIRRAQLLESAHILPKPFDLDDIERLLRGIASLI